MKTHSAQRGLVGIKEVTRRWASLQRYQATGGNFSSIFIESHREDTEKLLKGAVGALESPQNESILL